MTKLNIICINWLGILNMEYILVSKLIILTKILIIIVLSILD